MRTILWMIGVIVVLGGAAVALAVSNGLVLSRLAANPNDAKQVALGARIYREACASCHGAKLEGQPDWQRRLPTGRLPAPPHDETGHTWHHPDQQLFDIIKEGIKPFAPPAYESDMTAFKDTLSDREIWAVLAFVKSTWPPQIRDRQTEISRRARP